MSTRMKAKFCYKNCLSFPLSACAVYCSPSLQRSKRFCLVNNTIASLTSPHVADTTVTCVGRDTYCWCTGHFIRHLFDDAKAAVFRSFWRNHDLPSMLQHTFQPTYYALSNGIVSSQWPPPTAQAPLLLLLLHGCKHTHMCIVQLTIWQCQVLLAPLWFYYYSQIELELELEYKTQHLSVVCLLTRLW